jgi:hypothetical protein
VQLPHLLWTLSSKNESYLIYALAASPFWLRLSQPAVGSEEWVSGMCYDPYKQPELEWSPKDDGFMHGTLTFGAVDVVVSCVSSHLCNAFWSTHKNHRKAMLSAIALQCICVAAYRVTPSGQRKEPSQSNAVRDST